MKVFESHVRAVKWHEESGCSKAVAMAKRSLLKSKLMEWAAGQGLSTEFTTMTDLFSLFVRLMFSGGCQTVINERLNQKVVDMQDRKTVSKQNSRMTRWYELSRCGLIEQYGRNSVEAPHSEPSIGSDLPMGALFEPPSVIESALPLDAVLEDNQFQTWTPQTLERAFHEAELMTIAYDKKDNALVAQSWQTKLLPCKQVILYRDGHAGVQAFWVMYNDGGSVSTWAVSR